MQGCIGDCYFMGSIIVLCEKPNFLKSLFLNEYNKEGIYAIWLCESGAWKIITIDDFFPCLNANSGACYARSRNNELWVMLIEKAYAKAYKNYKNIILGFAGDALKDLTGAPSEYIDLGDQKKVSEIIQKLKFL